MTENREPSVYHCAHCNLTKRRDEVSLLSTGEISRCCNECWHEYQRGREEWLRRTSFNSREVWLNYLNSLK